MKVSENQLHKLTGKARQTVARVCADLPHEDGPRGARMYDSEKVLPILYAGDKAIAQDEKESLTLQRTAESYEKTVGLRIDNETKLRERIKVEVYYAVWEETHNECAGIVKKSRLTELEKEEMLSKYRDVPGKVAKRMRAMQ